MNVLRAAIGIFGLALLGLLIWAALSMQDLHGSFADQLAVLTTLPWGVVTCLLMPLGLERLALVPMGWGIDVTIWVAQWVSALPGNVWAMPRLPR